MIWRCDKDGWYQFLRRFKRDNTMNSTLMQLSGLKSSAINASATFKSAGAVGIPGGNPAHNAQLSKLTTSGVLSLTMHPDKNRPQILVMTHDPSQLRVFNMSSYRVQTNCIGFRPNIDGIGAFSRATFSADGRFAVSGIASRDSSSASSAMSATGTASAASQGDLNAPSGGGSSSKGKVTYGLNVWDSQNGNRVKCHLAGNLVASHSLLQKQIYVRWLDDNRINFDISICHRIFISLSRS